MHMTPAGRAFLARLEGRRLHVYTDTGGALTIGIGHCLTRAERASGKLDIGHDRPRYADGITEAQCEALLTADLSPLELGLALSVAVPLTEHQRDALLCFAFNIGLTAFRGSTLLRVLNQGDYAAVPTQLRRWVHDNGMVVPGLQRRREAESAWWDAREDVV